MQQDFNTLIDNVSSILGLPVDSVQDAFDSVTGQPVEDITGNYNIPGVGTLKLTFFDTKYFRIGMDYFRPVLRGFIVLMLFFFNYKQLLTFLGQDPGILGRVSSSDDNKKGGGKE